MKQMTLIEMNGFLKGKCIPRDLKVNETNAEYLVRKFGELESKLETALRECRSAGITVDNLEAKCAALTSLGSVAGPVVPDEMTSKQASRSYCGEVRGYRDGWNACRAAILKSFCNSEQLDEVGSWNNHRNTPTDQDGNHTEQNLDMVDHFGDATQKAMLHGSEPETDNTNKQFESLGRGDK